MNKKIIIGVQKNIYFDISKDIFNCLNELDYEVEIVENEQCGPFAAFEYIIPAIITIVVSSYFSGFFKELGSQSAQKLIKSIKNSYNKLNNKNPRLMQKSDIDNLLKEAQTHNTEEEKNNLIKSHKSGKSVSLISFGANSNSHPFIAIYVLQSGLSNDDIESALLSLKSYSKEADNFLLSKHLSFNELEELKKKNPPQYIVELRNRGFTTWRQTTFYYSSDKSAWINSEIANQNITS